MSFSPKPFLEHLITNKIIDSATAEKYEIGSINKNLPIDEYLFLNTNVKKEAILAVKAKFLNSPYIDIAKAAIDPQAINLISESVASRYNLIAYSYNPKTETVYIATDNPLDVNLADFLERKIGKKVILSLGYKDDIKKTINISYAQGLSPDVRDALKDVEPAEGEKLEQTMVIREAPIAKIVNTILEFAVKSRSSDIHIEPQETKTRVRYRIDGILQEKLTLPKTIHDSLVSRIKILSGMKIDEKRIPQDGRFTYALGGEEVDLRISTLPTVNGEKIVMRLLKKTGGLPSLADLGLRGTQFKDLEEVISKPYGIILVTGPTGSGKTTTLYSVLTRLNKSSVNIVTLEDPVEYQINGINQVQINPQAGLTFANGLRSFLRQDPNIILVGEIRDKETTQLAIQAALTGHLVFSTLHTNDSATSIPRLIDLGGEPFLIASVLNASIAQRILRRTCSFCKELYDPETKVVENIKAVLGDLLPKAYREGQPIKIAKGKGCAECGQTGYLGRIAVFELLKVTTTINRMILQEASAKEIESQAKKEGLIIMKQDGFLKVLDGLTTIEEVLRVAEI